MTHASSPPWPSMDPGDMVLVLIEVGAGTPVMMLSVASCDGGVEEAMALLMSRRARDEICGRILTFISLLSAPMLWYWNLI